MKTYKDFSRKQICNIATEYANSGWSKSESYFIDCYKISSSTFYSIIHNAISKCIVSDKIAEKIRDKACRNSYTIAGKSASVRSFGTYRRLFEQREVFKFSKSEAIKYAEKFVEYGSNLYAFCKAYAMTEKLLVDTLRNVVENGYICSEFAELIMDKLSKYYTEEFARSKLSQNEFCTVHPLSRDFLVKLLKRGIINNLVSDGVVLQMRNNAFKRHDPNRVYEFFSYLELERNNFKSNG